MSSKTKIIVLRMKEIIYTAIFVGFALFLLLLLLFMLRPGKNDSAGGGETAASRTTGDAPSTEQPSGDAPSSASVNDTAASYTPGIYSAAITLGSQSANVEVTVDAHQITSVTLVPLSESVTTMYPLMHPAMEELAAQILEKQSLEGLEYPAGAQYTSVTLMQAVETAVEKAKKPDT
ncbi:MAG: hypothetical protein E7246_09825 [Lachnoclostridium sp.]|nr:hypothetical protein [Lachnoclostridium sp.]